MPRGVYDRSKSKEQRQAEKSAGKSTGHTPKAVKAKAQYKAKATGGAVIKNVTFETTHFNPSLFEASTHFQTVMNTAVQGFNAIQGTGQGQALYNLIEQTAQRLNQVGQAITDQLFPEKQPDVKIETQDTAHISTRKVKNGHASTVPAPAPVVAAPAPAPIPFNPPAPPQQ